MTKRLVILLGGTALALALTAAPVHFSPTSLSIVSSVAHAGGDEPPREGCFKKNGDPAANINVCLNAGKGGGDEDPIGGQTDPGNKPDANNGTDEGSKD